MTLRPLVVLAAGFAVRGCPSGTRRRGRRPCRTRLVALGSGQRSRCSSGAWSTGLADFGGVGGQTRPAIANPTTTRRPPDTLDTAAHVWYSLLRVAGFVARGSARASWTASGKVPFYDPHAACSSSFWPRSPLARRPAEPQRFEFAEPHMGTKFRIVLYAADEATADAAAKAAFARVAELEPDHERLQAGQRIDAALQRARRSRPARCRSATTCSPCCPKAERSSELSDGAFDVTVGPVVQLWRQARGPHDCRTRTSWRRRCAGRLQEDGARPEGEDGATLTVPGMQLDLGGIAKGYAADEALKVLTKHGITRALVAAGGDIAVRTPPPGPARLADRHRPAARRQGEATAPAEERGRLHVRRRGAVRRDRRQALFAHRRSEDRPRPDRPAERDRRRPPRHPGGQPDEGGEHPAGGRGGRRKSNRLRGGDADRGEDREGRGGEAVEGVRDVAGEGLIGQYV